MTLKLNGTNSEAAPAYAGDDADTGLQCGTDELKLVTGGTARATVDSSGNLGVGTATPDALCHINKTSGSTLYRASVAGNSTVGLEIVKTGSTTQSWRIVDGQTVNGKLEFYDVTDSATRMCIDGSGNIGIGLASPSYALHVSNASAVVNQLQSSGSSNVYIRLQNTDNSHGYLGYESKALAFYASNTGGTLSQKVGRWDADGLKFGSDSAATNALNDYEEGFFTPTLVGSSGGAAASYTYQNGGYVKVGNVVHVYGYLKVSSKGTSISGSLKVGGFPFSVKNNTNYYHAPGIGWYTGFSGVTVYGLGFDIAPNATDFTLARGSGTGVNSVTLSQITDTFGVEWAFTYRTE
jgi:hypothetical protein